LQLGTPDHVRGRVFAFSLAVRNGVSAPGLFLAGYLLDGGGMTPSEVSIVNVVFNVLLGLWFGCWYYPKYKHTGQDKLDVSIAASEQGGADVEMGDHRVSRKEGEEEAAENKFAILAQDGDEDEDYSRA